jgi:hypothetical protein
LNKKRHIVGEEYLFEFATTPDQQQLAKDLYENLWQVGSMVLQKMMCGSKSMVIRSAMCSVITHGLGMMPIIKGPLVLHVQKTKLTSTWYEHVFGKCGVVLRF